MKYIDFLNNYKSPLFRLQNLRVAGFSISALLLSRWAKKHYITRLINGVYLINDRQEMISSEIISFTLLQPSYISLETALAFHGLIPEIVFNCTAVNTKKTITIKTTSHGAYIYRKIKKHLFFGYNVMKQNDMTYLLAEPEKALLDYLYLNSSRINNADDIEELRLNEERLRELNQKKIHQYLLIFNSKKLNKIIKLLFNSLNE